MVGWQPLDSDYETVLHDQNPWHATATVPSALAPRTERRLASVLWKRLLYNEPRRHQVILGPRRVGKTTVLYQTVRRLMDAGIDPTRIWWLRLDHPLLIESNLGDLVRLVLDTAGATADDPLFLMLDEVVYARQWDLWLKTFYDERWPVRIAATSSSTPALRGKRRESGVGRWEEQHLLPCQLVELLDFAEIPHTVAASDRLADTLTSLPPGRRTMRLVPAVRECLTLVGGFPELLTGMLDMFAVDVPDDVASPLVGPLRVRVQQRDMDSLSSMLGNHVLESQRVLRTDAVERAVYKDIPQTAGVDNPMMLERLLYVLAGQFTGIVSPQSISRELGIAQPTLDRYLSYLEQAYLVFTLTNYSGSESSVQRRGRKLYFTDSAVRNAALQRGLAPLGDAVERGKLLENLAASSMHTLAAHEGVRLHHWRDGNHEVDLIYDDPRGPLAFEIASSPSHGRSGLEALVQRHPRLHGHAYLVAPQAPVAHAAASGTGIGTLPLNAFLLAVGEQAHQAMLARLGVPG